MSEWDNILKGYRKDIRDFGFDAYMIDLSYIINTKRLKSLLSFFRRYNKKNGVNKR